MTPTRLKACIRLVKCNHDPLCCGFRWHINDQDALAELVGWTMQGYGLHAERILANFEPLHPVPPATIKSQAIELLTLPPGTAAEAKRWHRDGLVFQHIAWIAAHISAPGGLAASIPHPRPADKGFDALLVPVDKDKKALHGIVICEEKATENPRSKIRDEVWPDIRRVEAGQRDSELNNELSGILRSYGVANLDAFIADAHWMNHRAYRVSITIGSLHDPDDRRRALFKGYDECAPGPKGERRRAETICIPKLRDWMDQFCAKVIAVIPQA